MGKKKLRNREEQRSGQAAVNKAAGNDAGNNGVASSAPAARFAPGGAYSLLAAGVTIISFLVFLPALSGEFLGWDDNYFITDNPMVRGPFNLALIKWAFTGEVLGLWLPVTVISLALDHLIWGYNAFGFHLTNNVVHSLNVLLVFVVTALLVEWGEGRPWSFTPGLKALVAATVTALLFGVHPLRVESVAWISERKDVLYGFFFLLSIFFYLKWRAPGRRAPGWLWYGAAVASFVLSLLSKPMAVMLPVVLVILDFCPLKRLSLGMLTRRDGIVEAVKTSLDKIPFFLISLVAGLITVKLNLAVGAPLSSGFSNKSLSTLAFVRGYMSYLYSTVYPSKLAPIYPLPENTGITDPTILVSLLSFLAVTAAGLFLIKKRGYVLAGWAYYVFSLLPVIKVAVSADRFSYLPITGPLVIIGIICGEFYERAGKNRRVAFVACVAAAAAVYSYATVRQTAVWKDTLTLWNHQIETYPDKIFRAYYNRGLLFARAGEYEKALKDYDKASELIPGNVRTADLYSSRGFVYMKLGDHKAALDDFNRAISFSPDFMLAYMNRGSLHAMQGRHEEAVRDHSTFISMKPDAVPGYLLRGHSYVKLGNLRAAAADFETAIKLSPKNGEAFYGLALVHSAAGNKELALKGLTAAARLGNPNAQAALKRMAERRSNAGITR